MPALLVIFSAIPIVAGAVRVGGLAGDPAITPENARFVADPLPLVLHIVSSSLWCLLGAFQFSSGIRRRYPRWHRGAGRVLAPLGLVSALTGLWMTLFYPRAGFGGPAGFDGPWVDAFRIAAGAGMTIAICLAVASILRRDFKAHGAWMMRGYALGLGVGTQVLTHVPFFLFPGIQGELARAICMGAGWAINLAVAERIIRSRSRASAAARLRPRSLPLHANS